MAAEPGQVWRSRDRRQSRHVKVLALDMDGDPDKVLAVRCTASGRVLGGRHTAISLDGERRLRGYELARHHDTDES